MRLSRVFLGKQNKNAIIFFSLIAVKNALNFDILKSFDKAKRPDVNNDIKLQLAQAVLAKD